MRLDNRFEDEMHLYEKILKKIYPEIVYSKPNEYEAEFIFYDKDGKEIISVNVADNSAFIFSHSFAKAFWGTEIMEQWFLEKEGYLQGLETWQYHLQQMVLEEEPLKYLEKFL